MSETNVFIHDWMKAATRAEQESLAEQAGTSRAYLYRLSSGQRVASAELASAIEVAAETLRAKSKGRLPRLMRYHLCSACALCPFALKCKNK